MQYFVFINIGKLEYSYCCIVSILISFDIISLAFVQDSIFAYFNLYYTMSVNLNQYRGTVGTFNNRYLICFRNSYQYVKCHLSDIDIGILL